MSGNEQLIKDLRKAFAEEALIIKKESDVRLSKHKTAMNNNIWKLLGLLVIVLGSAFGGVFALINNNSNDIEVIQSDRISDQKETRQLQTDVGIIDGKLHEQNPDAAAFGNAFDKYIKRRGIDK